MKKQICLLLIIALLLPCLLLGCDGIRIDDGVLTIVATTFASYDWVRHLVGDREDVETVLLLDHGVDMHSYQPTTDDIITLTSCDLLVHIGGVDDAWIHDALSNASTKPTVINLMEALGDGVKQEEIKDGMEHGHEGDESCTDDAHDQAALTKANADEHIWLSLKNAVLFCQVIADRLTALDPDHADAYAQNLDTYTAALAALDAEYQSTVAQAARKTLLFADRFPFRYLADDYGLNYFAAFAGCSADTNASFDTVTFLAEQINALDLPSVLVIKDSPVHIAEGLIQNTRDKDQTILTLDAMQSVTTAQIRDGMTYLGVMQQNLHVLSSALN